MMMKLFQWRYSLLLLPIMLWLSINSAHADITCNANMNNGTVNISNTITPSNANDAQITATLTYSCTNNTELDRYVSVCLGVDGGDEPNAVIPRYMTSPNGSKLAFTMTLPDGEIWGTRTSGFGTEYKSGAIYIPARSTTSGQSNISRQIVINVSLLPSNYNAIATPETYTNDFKGELTFKISENSNLTDCLEGVQDKSNPFSFTVKATVIPSCEITAKPTDINLGSIAASATNIKGSTSISLKCTNTAPYTIGLAPSNKSVDGAGIMTGTTPNSDVIPYQLNSADGKIWGTITTESVGNGVAGNGTGVTKIHTVYVTVPSADFKPDTYSDTVTVHVNY